MAYLPRPGAFLRSLCAALLGRVAAAVRALPLVATAPAALVPVALAASFTVAAFAAASAPIEKPVAVPERAATPSWDARVADFAVRLEDVFGIDPERAGEFADWILAASERQALPPELIAGLIYTESSFRKRVRSWAGAVGPAQVKPRFWREFCGGADLTDPEHNVYCGAQVLAHYMDQCGEYDCALRLYNVGPANLRDPYYHRRSGHYLAKVEGHRSRLEGVAGL